MSGPRRPALSRPRRRREQVAPPSEPVDDPVEVSLALPIPFVVAQARVATMVVPGDRQVRKADRASGPPVFALVAQDQAPPDVEVAVEAEPLVERAPVCEVGPTEGNEVALDRVDVAGGCVLELPQIVRDDPPPAR